MNLHLHLHLHLKFEVRVHPLDRQLIMWGNEITLQRYLKKTVFIWLCTIISRLQCLVTGLVDIVKLSQRVGHDVEIHLAHRHDSPHHRSLQVFDSV